jgi:flotillin
VLPEIAAAISEPLSRAGATTIISNGNGHEGTGASRLSQDVVQVLSQLSPIMEQLAGVDLKRFLQDVSKIPAAVGSRADNEGLVRVDSQTPVQPPRAS